MLYLSAEAEYSESLIPVPEEGIRKQTGRLSEHIMAEIRYSTQSESRCHNGHCQTAHNLHGKHIRQSRAVRDRAGL